MMRPRAFLKAVRLAVEQERTDMTWRTDRPADELIFWMFIKHCERNHAAISYIFW